MILTQNRWYIVAPQIGVGYNDEAEQKGNDKVIATPQIWVAYIPLCVVRVVYMGEL